MNESWIPKIHSSRIISFIGQQARSSNPPRFFCLKSDLSSSGKRDESRDAAIRAFLSAAVHRRRIQKYLKPEMNVAPSSVAGFATRSGDISNILGDLNCQKWPATKQVFLGEYQHHQQVIFSDKVMWKHPPTVHVLDPAINIFYNIWRLKLQNIFYQEWFMFEIYNCWGFFLFDINMIHTSKHL